MVLLLNFFLYFSLKSSDLSKTLMVASLDKEIIIKYGSPTLFRSPINRTYVTKTLILRSL